jgi:endonuclease YncB( thermonuclease family)
MASKPRYKPDPPKRAKRSFDLLLVFTVILAIVVLAFGLHRVARYVSGESRLAASVSPQIIRPGGRTETPANGRTDITIVDGDTVSSGGMVYRLAGFDTPERGDRALCDKERELAEKAAARLRALIASGEPTLERVACACRTGTEGTQACEFGRSCAYLRVNGEDVGETLIREGFANPFVCGQTSCPPRKPWC